MDGLYLLLLGSVVFLFLGSALENVSPAADVRFQGGLLQRAMPSSSLRSVQ